MSGLCVTLAAITGCRSTPVYRGDGEIINTTYWADGLVRTPEYTIKLASFGLDENLQQEFDLGDVGFFRGTMITVSVHFLDDHNWWHFSKLHPSEKTPGYVQKFRLRDLDKVAARLKYRLVSEAGDELLRSDKLFGDYAWSGFQAGGGWSRIETYDPANVDTLIQRGAHLKLWFSYSGDATLTNRAELVVVCRAK